MRSVGYTTLQLLLTPLQFGVPNSRLRYYFLAKKEPLQFQGVGSVSRDEICRHIPGHGLAWSDPRLENQPSLSKPDVDHTILDYLDDLGKGCLEYAVPDKVLEKWGRLFDIVKPSFDRTCCFTRGTYLAYSPLYSALISNRRHHYRLYSTCRESRFNLAGKRRLGCALRPSVTLAVSNSLHYQTTAVFNAFLEARARGDADAVKILHPLRLRYFSPSELLRLFAFDPLRSESLESTFVWPDSTSKKSKYKLIGNSINVKVVQTLIEYLFKEPE